MPSSSSTPDTPAVHGARRPRSSSARRPSRHRPGVGAHHLRPERSQRERRGHPGAGQADHEVRAGRQRRAREHAGDCVGRSGGITQRHGRRGLGLGAPTPSRPQPRGRVGPAALELEALGLERAADLGRVAERGAADGAVVLRTRWAPGARRG